MLQLADGLGLDLADALAGDLEDPADLFERVGVAVADAVAQLDDLALAVGQRLEHLLDLVLEHLLRGGADRALGRLVLDEVAEVAVLALADRAVEADRVLADLHHPLASRRRSCRRASAISSIVGSRPISWSSFFVTLRSLLIVSIMWTGMRIVRAWSAMARVMAWRIHHVA